MRELLMDNIFVMFGGRVFQQTVHIPVGANCANLLVDLFLYSYEADFIQWLLKKNEKQLERSFNFTFSYIDYILSLFYIWWLCWSHLSQWAWNKATARSSSYLDLHLVINSEGRLRTKPYDKRDDFNFPIVNSPFICTNIPEAPTYGVYISQLIRYFKACGSYKDFHDRGCLLTRNPFERFTAVTMTWLYN